jgi:hypothetical protein
MTTITLELLRHGTAHNQLLSPLTPYIALAGNRPAETVHVPEEHAQMLARLRRLRYSASDVSDDEEGDAEREYRATADLREASLVVTKFLESIRGLSDAIVDGLASGGREEGTLHLRLIVSANELAMLPFELAQGPLVFGGSDMLSALRPPPVVITRESRRVPIQEFTWAVEPKILLVAADPGGRGLPIEACLLALRKAYVHEFVEMIDLHKPSRTAPNARDDKNQSGPTPDSADPPPRRKARNRTWFRRKVHVLLDASLEDVQREMADGKYEYVIILAHGGMRNSLEARPTVLFHQKTGSREADPVSGERLATALCSLRRDNTAPVAPKFVSLLVCDSANQGSVLFAGGSIGHAIHEVGVPLVVSSQFPLTFQGAALMTEVLYARLLANEDPIAAVAEARRRLFTELGRTTHDWAALVAYATLPNDLEKRVQKARFQKELARLGMMYNAVDRLDRTSERTLGNDRIHEFNVIVEAFEARYAQYTGSTTRERDGGQEGAFALANAFMRLARLSAHGMPVLTMLKERLTGAAAPSEEQTEAVRVALRKSLTYCKAYVAQGGPNPGIHVMITTILELLGFSDERRLQSWSVAEWYIDQYKDVVKPTEEIELLCTEIIHLMHSSRINKYYKSETRKEEPKKESQSQDEKAKAGTDQSGKDLAKEYEKISEKAVEAARRMTKLYREYFNNSVRGDGIYSRQRLRRYQETWWGDGALDELFAEIEKEWEEGGIPNRSPDDEGES